MSNSNDKSGIIVAFHLGRGGHFYNAGHKTYIGEKNFQDLQNSESNNLFTMDRDERGRFCTPFLVAQNGNIVSEDPVNGLTGTLDFDSQYDTSTAVHIEDCTDEEIEMIAQDTNQLKSYELTNWLEAYNPEWTFDKYGHLELEEEELSDE